MVETSTRKGIAALGHVGLYVRDLAECVDFWCRLLDMQITDGSVEGGFVFLSADPEVEHHMLLLRDGRTAGPEVEIVQQVSFWCHDLGSVIEYSHRLRSAGVPTMDVSHGNAIGVYFRDPDGNRCEVYWHTGLDAHQVFVKPIDLDLVEDAVWSQVRADVARYGTSGVREKTEFTLEYPSRTASS